MRRWLGAVAIVVLTATTAAACGGGNEVGDADLLDEADGSGGTRLGAETTTTTAAPVATTSPPVTQPTATTKKPTATTAAPTDSQSKPAFDPPAARIYQGTCAKWTNNDAKARSVIADAGQFDSGSIAPGASWTYCGASAGKFSYHDGTRPYAVGTIEVVAR
jgi:plastocyanin